MPFTRALGVSVAFVCVSSVPAHARADDGPGIPAPPPTSDQEATPSTPTPVREPAPWGFNGTFGYGGAGGDFGNLFRNPLRWEYNFFRQKGPWRVGLGLTFGSFKMKEPYQDELEWGYQEISLAGTRMFKMKGRIRPYVQLRGGLVALRPRSDLFKIDPLPPDFVSGEHTKERSTGFSVAVVPGVEWKLGRAAYLDTSLGLTYFKVGEYDLSPVGQPPRGSGTAWEGRLGITWFPNGEQPGQAGEAGTRDAWGVKRSYGWAIGQMLAINNVGSVSAQWMRDVDWSETSPRSWWANIKGGFSYDSDQFSTNQYIHPFNGAAYFNSGRANGVPFWPSAAISAFGAYYWEFGGETGPASINDMFSTTLGGIMVGSFQYGLSSEILDNQAHGWGRFGREAAAFIVDPVRGFDRLVRGDAKNIAPNPADPMDWRPGGATFVAFGTRTFGEAGSEFSFKNAKTYPMMLLDHSYGDVFHARRRGPMDYMDITTELNFGGPAAISRLVIRGNLASWTLGEEHNHVLGIVQHYEYRNNASYTFGGQSVGAALFSRFRPTNNVYFRTRVDAYGILLGAINSEYAKFAEVGVQERIREYDYGPGYGLGAEASLFASSRQLVLLRYLFNYIDVTNGSAYNIGTVGGAGRHYIQYGSARVVIPIKRALSIGADAVLFHRDSHFTVTNSATGETRIQHLQQRNPQVKIYIAINQSQH